MIERISNHHVSNATRITAIEKVNPSPRTRDILKENEQSYDQNRAKISKNKMEEVIQGMNDFIHPVNKSIRFVLHDKLNDYYITVVNDQTNEVIKEIPSKKLLDTYANMMEFIGLLLDKKI